VKFVVMIFFRHIKLSSGLIGKDVKTGEKFHPQQLFGGHFRGEEVLYLPMLLRGPYQPDKWPMGDLANAAGGYARLQAVNIFAARFLSSRRYDRLHVTMWAGTCAGGVSLR
jgi:hypothetical protein